VSDAMAARLLVKEWRKVVVDPVTDGISRVHAPSPSRNATHVGVTAAQ